MTDGKIMPGLWRGEAPLILASRSSARQAILAGVGIPFEVVPADVDERRLEADLHLRRSPPAEIALALAREKARSVGLRHPHRLVLAADQILALGDRLFAKPRDRAAAAEQLAALSGKTHVLHSALALYSGQNHRFEVQVAARLTMRVLSDDFIACYLDAVGAAASTSVGAYQIEAMGAHLFEAIEGDYWTILGLPILPLLAYLREQGIVAA